MYEKTQECKIFKDIKINATRSIKKMVDYKEEAKDIRFELGNAYEKLRLKYDNVNKPAHYQGKVECIDAIEAAVEGLEGLEAVCTANVIKYVWRWKKKNGVEDLQKATWYLNKLMSIQNSDKELS